MSALVILTAWIWILTLCAIAADVVIPHFFPHWLEQADADPSVEDAKATEGTGS